MNPTFQAILLCSIGALGWGMSPLLGRASGLTAMVMAVLVGAGTFAAVLPVAAFQNYSDASTKALTLAFAAGVANGVGIIVLYLLVSGSTKGLWEVSRVVPVLFVLTPVVIVLGAWLFYGEKLTYEKLAGLALAVGAIWLLNK